MEHELKYDEKNEVVVLSSNANLKLIDIEPLSENLKNLLEGKKFRQLISIISDVYVVENRETREALAMATRFLQELYATIFFRRNNPFFPRYEV